MTTSPERDHPTAENDVYPRPEMTEKHQEKLVNLYREAQHYLKHQLLTYGGLGLDVCNRILKDKATKLGIPFVRSEVAPDEDEAIGLRIPHVWYMSQNPDMLAIAMWYIHLQTNKQASVSINQAMREYIGTVGMVECYRHDELMMFAEENGYGVFSLPFDLVVTASHITKNIDDLKTATPEEKWREFIKDVLGNAAKREIGTQEDVARRIASIQDQKERHLEVIKLMKYYWQDVLVPRGIHPDDEDVIIVDIKPDRPAGETLDVTRSPFLVFVGGNLAPEEDQSPEEIHEKNIELAKTQYPEGTRIIAPCFKVGDHKITFTLRQENPDEVTPETLLLSLIVLREIGQTEVYERLLGQYEELCKQQ